MTVLLVDDHEMVRAGFRSLLEINPKVNKVLEASDGPQAFDMYQRHKPDIVTVDLNLPADSTSADQEPELSNGLETIRRIISHFPDAKILVITAMENNPFPMHVLKAGAKGYLTKRCAPTELYEAVETVNNGETYLSEVIRSQITEGEEAGGSPLSALTKRELQIFSQLAMGKTVMQVAEDMFLSPKTVHAHRANIMRKLKLTSNSELIRLAIRHGIT
ncbi:MAG: response regulator [Pontibacterium sp.]